MEYVNAIKKDDDEIMVNGKPVTLRVAEIVGQTDVYYVVPVSWNEVSIMDYDSFHKNYEVIK